jgi:hypothetical protein
MAMGGYGSGRRGGAVTAEATNAYIIDVSSLTAALRNGRAAMALPFDGGRFPVLITIDASTAENASVELFHRTRDEREGAREVRDRVRLTWTEPTYGGRRWWFLCPRTACRTTRLFLPRGGWHFWSRRAYGLGYACQREDRFSRLQRRAATLNRQLGGEGWSTWDVPPPKPKWMRWRTYERKYRRWEWVVARANEEFIIQGTRLLERFDRRRVRH